ncbi:MAG: hypothetical protein HY930_02505 [Euryarchaeota archaeon]|nr:hypothetical protein [Euryarchaeota archaeon]
MKLFVRAEVYPTENPDKVKAAIRNLFEAAVREEEGESVKYLVGAGEGRESLKRFYTLLRSQSILDSARRILLSKIEGSKTSFSLNKQAAYAGAVSFSESTLLGSVEVEIYDEEIEKLVDWLSPKTIGGKEI